MKAVGITFAVVVGLIILAWFTADIWLTRSANRQLRAHLSQLEGCKVDYADLDIRIPSRTVVVKQVLFSSLKTDSAGVDSAGIRLSVDRLTLKGLAIKRLIKKGELVVHNLTISHPVAFIRLADAMQVGKVAEHKVETGTSSPDGTSNLDGTSAPDGTSNSDGASNSVSIVGKSAVAGYIKTLQVRRVSLDNGSFTLSKAGSRFSLSFDSTQLGLRDVGYALDHDSLFYNDSTYHLALRRLRYSSADGTYAASLERLTTDNAEELLLSGLRGYSTVRKTEYADLKGKQPVTWSDVRLQELSTTSVNLFRQFKERRIEIERVSIAGESAHLYRDERYPARQPYGMPLDGLLDMSVPLHVGQLTLTMPVFDVELSTTDLSNVGALQMQGMRVDISNLTNRHGASVGLKGSAKFSQGGAASFALDMRVNRAADFSFAADITGLKGSTFNDFLHPLFGLEVEADLKKIQTRYSGDRRKVHGKFCMAYNGLKVHVFKEDAPYVMIARNAGVINFIAPKIVPSSNPRHPGTEPAAYEVDAERDAMKDFPVYLFGPIIDGVTQTLLPGFVVKLMKNSKNNKQ